MRRRACLLPVTPDADQDLALQYLELLFAIRDSNRAQSHGSLVSSPAAPRRSRNRASGLPRAPVHPSRTSVQWMH